MDDALIRCQPALREIMSGALSVIEGKLAGVRKISPEVIDKVAAALISLKEMDEYFFTEGYFSKNVSDEEILKPTLKQKVRFVVGHVRRVVEAKKCLDIDATLLSLSLCDLSDVDPNLIFLPHRFDRQVFSYFLTKKR